MASYLETRYLPPTNGGKGARIKVIGAGSRITLATFDYDYAARCAHQAAAQAYAPVGYEVNKAFPTANGFVFRMVSELEGN